MTTAIVNEDIHHDITDWSVSFDGYNTGDISQTVICINKDEALKLKKIADALQATTEPEIIIQISNMCDESLDPETHDMWCEVKKHLIQNRKALLKWI